MVRDDKIMTQSQFNLELKKNVIETDNRLFMLFILFQAQFPTRKVLDL